MPDRLFNKIAIITGSSSGIGRATALLFAREGCTLLLSDITPSARPEHTSDDLPGTTLQVVTSLGGTAAYQHANTSLSSDVEALIAKAVELYGRLDIMVNNAGIAIESGEHGSRPVWEVDESGFERTLDVNVKGVFLGVKFASKQMVGQEPLQGSNGDRGWVVNLASVYGLGGDKGIASYVTSKHAVMGLTKAAAWDCAPHRIHVNALCPGYTQTALIHNLLTPEAKVAIDLARAQHPFGGLGTPQDVARAALFLCSEDASWITGIGLPVDGGYSCK